MYLPQGKINSAFKKDEGDEFPEDMEGFDYEDLEDKSYISRIKVIILI